MNAVLAAVICRSDSILFVLMAIFPELRQVRPELLAHIKSRAVERLIFLIALIARLIILIAR